MQRILFFIAGLLLSAQALSAQTLFIGPEQSFNFRTGEFDLLGRVGNNIYTYTADNKGYFLNAYNDSMRLLSIVALDFFPKKTSGTDFVVSGDHILAFYQAEERSNIIQYAAVLDQNARLVQKPKAIDSIKKAWIGSSGNTILIEASHDKDKIAVLKFKNNSADPSINVKLYDKALNRLGTANIRLSNKGSLDIHQVTVDNSGMIYVLGISDSREATRDGNIAVWALDAVNRKSQQISFPFDGKFPSTTKLQLDLQQNTCYIAGLYSDKKFGNVSGAFYGTCTSDNKEPLSFQTFPFPDSVYVMAGSRKKKVLDDFNAGQLIIKNDGGFLLITEDVAIVSRNVYNGPAFGYYSPFYNNVPDESIREYHYNDILVLNYGSDSKLQWNSFIRKEQISQNDGGLFSSYGLLNSGGSLVFIFNDFIKRNSGIQLAAIDASGNLQMQRLDDGNSHLDWLPKYSKQTGNKEIILPFFESNNMIGFGRVVF